MSVLQGRTVSRVANLLQNSCKLIDGTILQNVQICEKIRLGCEEL
jgi:hypothetical protein